jgi:hypothetical protein
MPINPRIRANNVFGETDDNPLTVAAISFNSAGLVNLPAVATKHAVLTFDPLRQNGDPEIVVVTAHTASSTTATISRGMYGTAAREHPSGTLWVHAPLNEDFISIVTSGTRPADPYEGQFIYETDTNKLIGHDGTNWAPRDAGGQIGYAEIIANSATFTSVADVAGLSTAVTIGSNRRIRISWRGDVGRSVADGATIMFINEGATVLTRSQSFVRVAAESMNSTTSVILTPTSGAHTYKIQGQTATGTGNSYVSAQAANPAYILVEDIGAA